MKQLIEQTNKTGFNVHEDLKHLAVNELQEITKNDRLNYQVLFYNVTGDLNLGVTIRSAHLLGANKFILFGRKRLDNRSLVGSHNYTNIEHVESPIEVDSNGNPLIGDAYLNFVSESTKIFNDYVEKNNLAPIFIDHCDNYLGNSNTWDFLKNLNGKIPCLVFGNEGLGIPKHFMRNAKYKVAIPQRGVIRSFNVSAAASIVMWDFIQNV